MRKIHNVKLLLAITSVCTLIAAQVSTGRVPSPTAARAQLPAPRLSPDIPPEVAFGPGVTSPETARPFFDYFSWQSFVALNWPAAVEPEVPASSHHYPLIRRRLGEPSTRRT